MLVYKLKQHLKQQTGLNYLKFWNDSLKSQSNKSKSQNNNFAYRVQERKKLTDLVSSNIQSTRAHVNKAWKQQGLV